MSETLTPKSEPNRAPAPAAFLRRRGIPIGAVVALAAAVGFVLWVTIGGSDPKPVSNGGQGVPLLFSRSNLVELAKGVPTPVYWVGPGNGGTYELTRTANGRVYVRYLPSGVEAGAGKTYLTVATYPLVQAYAATQGAATQNGAVRIAVPGNAIAFFNRSKPRSVYYAEQGYDYQVEVFAPSAAQAHSLVASGRLRAIARKASTQPVVASVDDLRKAAAAAHHPVYWLGAKPGYTYELTQTEDGKIYVRYLPAGVAAGSKTQYLTVGTYPFPRAFPAVRTEAGKSGAARIELGDGGLAVVDAAYPQSVHAAYPGSNYQIEVFDPALGRASRLVTSGQLRQVR